MSRCLTVLGLLSFCFFLLDAKLQNVDLNSEAAILYNPQNGVILYEKNIHKQYHPASTTKVATALYALHCCEGCYDRMITADRESLASVTSEAKKRANYVLPAYWQETDGTHIGLKKDEQMMLRDLLFGLLIASGNDAANVIAREVGGTIPDFVQSLNEYLKQHCGCKNTEFQNPHGLHHPKHVTTPYDMALITAKAMKYPLFNEIVISDRFMRPKTNKQEAVVLAQGNHLVRKSKPHYYAKAIGVKTGYTSIAQSTLVAAARDGKRTLIAVLFKAPKKADTFTDAKKLFEAAFNEVKVERILVQAGPQEYTLEHSGASRSITTYVAEPAAIRYYPSEEPQLKGNLQWKEVEFPISQGQVVGEIEIQNNDGKVVGIVPLLAQEDVAATWNYWFRSFF